MDRPQHRPEILAPAGDEECLRAAVRAGADAVYFGLSGFNARARATNFDEKALAETMRFLHTHGVKGYVTLNTLVFDSELKSVEAAIRTCAAAGVDAVIVQDLGVAHMVRAIAPDLPLHASTQMTCTDAGAVELARDLGASRVILARELSIEEIAAIRKETDVELEVFVHGALCIAYSGQCLTSEAIGGRSANRGACAQACRLPYELIVDGEKRELDERAFLLSPEDLEASALVAELAKLGISSLKIEGRLKGPEYVAATTRLYRAAVEGKLEDTLRDRALQTFTRGSGPGFLAGVDHQRLVEAKSCDHRGLYLGTVTEIVELHHKPWLRLKLDPQRELLRGDGILVEGGFGGEGELGGRVWDVRPDKEHVLAWLGPDKDPRVLRAGRRVFKTNDPIVAKVVLEELAKNPRRRSLSMRVEGELGAVPKITATLDSGISAQVYGDLPIEVARSNTELEKVLREKLGRLGDTPFELGELHLALPKDAMIPPSSLNRARRTLIDDLIQRTGAQTWSAANVDHQTMLAAASLPERAPPPRGLFVLCRTLEQAEAAYAAGADGVVLDFLDLVGTAAATKVLRAAGRKNLALAPPRIRKPGEEKIERHLLNLEPDALLVRGLGALRDAGMARDSIPRVGDFSLNVTNRLSAAEVLSRGLAVFTPSFDLDSAQLLELLDGKLAPFAEVVVHHPMPLFHMEHCVIAALLSTGRDYRDCGRPCDHHKLSLRDRAGMDHPVEADVGCRNTVFHAAAQSAASLVPALQQRGVARFRIELVRETRADVERIVSTYRRLLEGKTHANDAWKMLRTESGYGVVRGSLRVV